ncbi:hypothetical protein ASC66_01080 [Leifsonia sp. Root4]|uniref:hypothetical protein n=1 Tax=Leifsonia sp. Root4 TaxID=1736525 RepID=UPI0006FBC873|nr:hypothetical protein [Leifsonia sp. Root4]KQW07622.1 hypothetical protein ASC66_01080 [Leifsonia sp. Root4]
MAHDIENAQERLANLRDKKEEREHKEAVERAGFDNAGDYEAWRVLEDLRALTLSERRAAEIAAEPKKANGGIVVGWAAPRVAHSDCTLPQRFLAGL